MKVISCEMVLTRCYFFRASSISVVILERISFTGWVSFLAFSTS